MRWLFVLLIGAGLGVAAAVGTAANELDPTPTVRALGIVANLGTVWAAAAVLAGCVLARALWSVLAGPIVLIAAAGGYYVWGSATGNRVNGFGELSDRTQLLLVAGVLMGPLLGLVGGVARTGDAVGMLARAVVPIALATEIELRYPLHGAEYTADPLLAWTTTCLLAVGVLGATMAIVSRQPSSQ